MIESQSSESFPKRILAFDMGAESSRCIVGSFAPESFEIHELNRFPTRNVEVLGTLYWDLLYLLSNIEQSLARYAREIGPSPASIGIDTWGVDFGLLDREGYLLSNPVQYRDHRSQAARLCRQGHAADGETGG